MQVNLNARIVSDFLGGEIIGDQNAAISGVSKIDQSEHGTLSFLANPKYEPYLHTTLAGVLLINEDYSGNLPEGKTYIKTEDAYLAFCKILNQFFNPSRAKSGISPFAIIEEGTQIGDHCYIGPNCYLGKNVVVGNNTVIHANTTVGDHSKIGNDCLLYSGVHLYDQTIIGNKCIIHSGTVIGSDGFGHAPQKDGTYVKIPQIGNVIIEDDVEIGSNCSIDRATLGSTIIRKGVRMDNLIQIAHNVEIDAHTVIASQSGIAGSTYIGKHCIIAGQVGVVGHLRIADRTMIGAQSGVNHSIVEPGTQVADSPAFALRDAFKSRVLYRKLPEINQRINQLERSINEIKNKS